MIIPLPSGITGPIRVRFGVDSIYGRGLSPNDGALAPNNYKFIEGPSAKGPCRLQLAVGPDFEEDTYQVQSDDSFGPTTFTLPFIKNHATDFVAASQGSMSAKQCEPCNTIPVGRLLESKENQHNIAENVGQLKESAKNCPLCGIILQSIRGDGNDNHGEVKISFSSDFWLCVHVGGEACTSPLKLYVDPDTEAQNQGVTVGLPFLSEPGSEMQFLTIRKWLGYCETQHSCYATSNGQEAEMPTRVIDVGSPEHQERIHLFESKGTRGRYIALSHRWGNTKPLTTTRENIGGFSNNIEFDILPRTFQDAVTVTRKLGIRFLWIDSLCIIQDDRDDWRRESQRMASVFSLAYCTIAATSGTDSTDGFLKTRPQKKWFKLAEKKEHSSLYVYASELVANFDRDIVNGPLNERAWVLQERALSSRVIHFTSEQTYLECGYGYVSENMTYKYTPLALLGGCRFPQPNPGFPKRTQESAFEEVFTHYTRLSITYATDRPHAIAGLEQKLSHFYNTNSTHGIVHGCLQRSLFWNRAGKERLTLTQFSDTPTPPSWSWMAYQGQIQYAHRRTTVSLDWDPDIRLKAIEALVPKDPKLWKLEARLLTITQSCSVEQREDMDCKIKDAENRPVGWARFDIDDECDIGNLEFISIATQGGGTRDKIPWKNFANAWGFEDDLLPGGLHYVLVISGKSARRLGVAVIHSGYLSSPETSQPVELL